MLSGSEALSYLMDKELIRTRDIVEHGVEIVNVSRRNLNYQVRVPERTGVFLKHGQDSHKTRTLRHEAEIYRLLESLDCDAIRAIVPKCYGFDDRVAVLTLELINGATSLFDTHHRTRKISSDIARRLGTALADFHMATAAPAVRQRFEQQLESRVPDALVLHAPSLTFYGAYASY